MRGTELLGRKISKTILGFPMVLLALATSRSLPAHPGDGLVVDEKGRILFVATHPFVDPDHHGALYRWSSGKGVERLLVSRHPSSNLHLRRAPDGKLFVLEQRYLAATGGPADYEGELFELEATGKRRKLAGPLRGRRALGERAFVMDRGAEVIFSPAPSRLVRRKASGEFHPLAGGEPGRLDGIGEEARFRRIDFLKWAPDGRLFVLDEGRIRTLDRRGQVKTWPARPLEHPSRPGAEVLPGRGSIYFDLAVAGDGSVVLADWGCRRVLRIRPDQEISVLYRSSPRRAPEGLAFQGDRLVVLESTVPPETSIRPRLIRLDLSSSGGEPEVEVLFEAPSGSH